MNNGIYLDFKNLQVVFTIQPENACILERKLYEVQPANLTEIKEKLIEFLV